MVPGSVKPVSLHVADKDAMCLKMLTSLEHGPVHVHDDLNGRLANSTLRELDAIEQWAEEACQTAASKAEVTDIGAQLLDRFMDALSRPTAFLNHALCEVLRILYCMSAPVQARRGPCVT